MRVELPKDVNVRDVRADLPAGWNDNLAITRRIGDAWLKEAETLLLQVPTVIVPYNCNYIFNPLHSDAARVELTHFKFPVDPRLFQFDC
ncbi:hypothetical protein FGL86_09885 [Pistricoccus aurantiacus]|uniref:RES domain-containing protein n=1 Tax=Pistricoccus aurantiacus TaxID=1883414 RepID=A0A5B8SRU4_9GAMM|nr:hypothetical protein FGL86_09885 [Pistricoccus aurantiacus]